MDDPSPLAASYPRWILLEYFGRCDDPDTKTVAHARTSKGRPIRVSISLAAPPAVSRLRLDSPGLPDWVNISSHVIAAHGDSVLVEIQTRIDVTARSYWEDYDDRFTSDHFIYCAGDAAADPSLPPSLSLLPPCYLTEQEEERTPKNMLYMNVQGTAILRRGNHELLVAALDFHVKNEEKSEPLEAELFLLRSRDWEWELKRLPVIHDEGKRQEVSCWESDKVIPVGDRFLIWVDYFRGIIYTDPWQETPQLRYVSLPVEPDPRKYYENGRGGSSYRSVCATDGGGAVRFVEVFPRCCCGCPGATACARSRYAFNITTWALRMDDMTTWEKVGVVDSDELWSLPGYHGVVPCIRPQYPTVSLDDPEVLCFMVRKNKYHMNDVDGDLAVRLIELDMRRMELRSIFYYDDEYCSCPDFLASAVSQYFDASSCSRTLARRKYSHLEAPATPSKLTLPRGAAMASPEEMLATLRGIPDLGPDEMLKAYGVLAWDESQFKFRSLLALPMGMRKNYCLLIGKLSCFDV